MDGTRATASETRRVRAVEAPAAICGDAAMRNDSKQYISWNSDADHPFQGLGITEPADEGGRSSRNKNENCSDDEEEIKLRLDVKRIAYLSSFIIVVFPLLPIILATIFGGLLALAEGTTFKRGFLYVVSNLLGLANPLTAYSPSNRVAGVVVIDIYVGVAALVCFGIMLNVVNLFRVPHAMNELIQMVVTNAFLVPLIALGIIIPAWTAGLCALFGSVLALAEKWHVSDGILYVLTNILNLGTPLTDLVPDTTSGKIVDVVVSSIAMGYVAIFADYVTTLNPSRYLRRKLRAYLIRMGVIDKDQTTSGYPLAAASVAHQHTHEDSFEEK